MLQMILHVLAYLVQKVEIFFKNLLKMIFLKRLLIFGSFKKIQIDNIDILVQRLSYVGEYGFELYIDINQSKNI